MFEEDNYLWLNEAKEETLDNFNKLREDVNKRETLKVGSTIKEDK